jgi:hypothetical protein
MREHACPGCGTLLAVDVVVVEDPVTGEAPVREAVAS